MKLCIPVTTPNGPESAIESHLPHAEHLMFFDTDTREYVHVSLRDQSSGAGESFRIDAVLCGSIDRPTKMALAQRGIRAFGTDAATVAEAVAQFESGALFLENEQESGGCGGQGHGGGCCGGKSHGAEDAHAGGCGGGGCGGGHAHDDEDHECCGGSGHDAPDHECCGAHDHGAEGRGDCGGHDHDGEGCGCGGALEPVELRLDGEAHIVAVSSQNKKTVTDHAGRCRNFWVYDISNGRVVNKTLLKLPIEQSFHETKGAEEHPLDGIDVLVTGGMSPGLQKRLMLRGIKSIVTTETDPDQVVADLLEAVG